MQYLANACKQNLVVSLKSSRLLIVGLFSSKWSTARCNSYSSRSCALPAQQQQSGPDISQLSPELQSQWDHDNNAYLGNIVIKPQSGRKVHWICRKCPVGHPHMWEAVIQNRSNGRGCPFCSGRKVCPHSSLASISPLTALEWDTTKTADSPHDYTACSRHQAHWLCNKCGHEWQARIQSRTALGSGCPLCASKRQRRRMPTVTASSSSMKQYWDSQRNAEQGLDPDAITIGSGQTANFTCDKCPQKQAHTWTARVQNVFKGKGCPCCSGQRVCKCNSLQTLRPDLAAEWCYAMNKETPDDYTAQSNQEVWWQNDKRGRWKASISQRFESTCMPEVTSVLNNFVQCCVGFTPPASSYVCIIHALSISTASLDVLACNVHLDVLHRDFAFKAVSCLHCSCIITCCELVDHCC